MNKKMVIIWKVINMDHTDTYMHAHMVHRQLTHSLISLYNASVLEIALAGDSKSSHLSTLLNLLQALAARRN